MRALAGLLILVPFAPPQESGEKPCRVHGRLIDVHGDPVSGATVAVKGWGQRIQRSGTPTRWSAPDPVVSAEDGSFELSFVPLRDDVFAVDVRHPAYGKIGWLLHALPFGEDEDLGEVTLDEPGVLTGYIVNESGELLVDGWQVSAAHGLLPEPRHLQYSSAGVDPSSGTFRIDDLPPGRIRISASGPAGTMIDDRWVESSSDEITEVELVYRGPDPRTRLVVTITASPFHSFHPRGGSVQAIDVNGKRTVMERTPGRSSDWQAVGMPSGVYSVEIRDPRFRPWREEGVHTGRASSVRLKGSAAVRLTVRDPENAGAEVRTYGLRARYHGTGFSPNTSFVVAQDASQAPENGLFEGIVPGDLELELRCPDRPSQVVSVPDLQPGETRELVVTLEAPRTLVGRVLHADGRPAVGVPVQITRGTVAGHDRGPNALLSTPVVGPDGKRRHVVVGYRDAESVTDAEGRFEFPALSSGDYAVRAIPNPRVVVDVVRSLGGDEEGELVVTLPAMTGADIRLLLPEGANVEGLSVASSPDPKLRLPRSRWPIDASGILTLDDLPPGEHELTLSIRMTLGPSASEHHHELGTILVEPAARVSQTFDLRTTFPVRGSVSATCDGLAAKQLTTRLDAAGEVSKEAQRGVSSLDGPGRSMHCVPPGRYDVRVVCAPMGWRWTRPEQLEVRPLEDFDVSLTVPLVERSVRFVDAAGRPVAGTEVTWVTEGLLDELRRSPWLRGPPATATTDEAGRLQALALPEESYRFARRAAGEANHVEVSWVAGDGALEIVLPDPR